MTTIRRLARRVEVWGMLLRCSLMPIACHYDLLTYYWAAHQIVYHHHLPFDDLLGRLYLFFPTAYLNMAWLWLIRPLLGSADLWSHDWFPGGDVYQSNVVAWQAFISTPHIGWTLLLLKLPTLLCEWGMIRLLCAMRADPVERKRLSLFLWLNPISLFVLYVFGSMEIYVALLLVFSLYALFTRRPTRSAWLLGCSAMFRFFPALFFPSFAGLVGRRPVERWRFLLLAAAPFLAYLVIANLCVPGAFSFQANYPSMNFLLSLKLPLLSNDVLYPFVIVYVVVTGIFMTRGGPPLERVIDAMLATLLVFYAMCFFHPQYFFWFIPLLALRIATHPELMVAFLIQVVAYTVYTFQWGRTTAGYLFAPLNPTKWMAMRSPSEVLFSICQPEKMTGLAHSVLAGVSLWMVYWIFQYSRRSPIRSNSHRGA